MSEIVLTTDQQKALEAFTAFLINPVEPVFVIEGYSGTGKSTLVKTILDRLPGLQRTAKLLNPGMPEYEVQLTATTNKAAENFGHITGMHATTIHSFLGLRIHTDYATRKTTLMASGVSPVEKALIFIDEASYVDSELLGHIFKLTRDCKIVFMGDPAQLTPVKSGTTPVFSANFPKAHLSQVVRQAKGNPIVGLSTMFRHTVKSGEFFSFKPDGHHIQHMDRGAFNDAILQEFVRDDWKHTDSKILGWTNKLTDSYNTAVRNASKGAVTFQVGDSAVCNKFISGTKSSIKTDQVVQITDISDLIEHHGCWGYRYTLDHQHSFFGPRSLEERKMAIARAKAVGDFDTVALIAETWIDLRAVYACTINKSQGSTYERVFIDLDDIKGCNSGNQIARMLYVAVSRAKQQVFLTGDFV